MPERSRRAATRKLWTARLPGGTSSAVERYTSSIAEDARLGVDDVEGSIAHARMLRRIGVLSAAELRGIERGLRSIREEMARGEFHFVEGDEDVHSAVERRLVVLAGEVAGKLHTGRSRNDQVATDLRLYARRACRDVVAAVVALQEALLERAGEHRGTVLPGYTHAQRAQVVSLGHHLLAYVEMLRRDAGRLLDARTRADVSPLGSGALAGSTVPLDRQFVRRELRFAEASANSMDAVSDRDFVIEIVSACALLMTHLSRFAEDMVLWSTSEFGFVELDDSDATGSSLMPQKKNADVFELGRARAGRVIGDLVTLLTVVKGIPMAYNRDLQEDKRALFDAVDTSQETCEVFAEVVGRLRFHTERMREAASDPALRATDVAEQLVAQGVPFRDAHALVARAVRAAQSRGVNLAGLSLREWREVSPRFDTAVIDLVEPGSALRQRVTPGGPGARSVAQQLARARREIAKIRRTMLEA